MDNKSVVVDRKKQIINIASKLFLTQGYDNTSTRALAKACNINIAGIYYYFKDKEAILFDIIDHSLTELLSTLNTVIVADDDPQINLTRIIRVFIQKNWEQKNEMGLVRESHRLSPEQLAIVNDKRLAIQNLIKKELKKLHEGGKLNSSNLTVITQSLISMINWSIYWVNPQGALTIDDIAEEIIKLWFHGILQKN